MAMIVGVCRLSLHFPESGSLKGKRHGLRKLIDRVRAKFNVAVAEVADQDMWQRATVGLVVVGNESRHVQSMLDNIISFAESLYVAEIFERQVELVTYSDGESLAGPADAGYPRAGWEPEPIRRPPPLRPQRRRP
jgi:uncharacterized protein YlxP (DUF503 family)